MIRRGVCAAISGTITLAGLFSTSFAQIVRFDIPSEEAGKSLPKLARQAGIQIVAPGDRLHGVITPEIKGAYEIDAALNLMLSGTGLVASRSADGIVISLGEHNKKKEEREGMLSGTKNSASILALVLGGFAFSPAVAQDTADLETVVITGYRASLENALDMKRQSTGVIDSITAEDIGKFPDSNLAESMQRVPVVALNRGDGGEGKSIAVRGLGSQFTRVRLNGMEGASSTGSSDIRSGYVSSRSFDFSTFASEMFNSLTVRKTSEADVEEGSLGATVDLSTPRPLSFRDDFTLALSAQETYDDLSPRTSPRGTAVVGAKINDNFGISASLAYTKRYTREEAWSGIDYLQGSLNHFCSPVGYAPQSPSTNAVRGSDATNCGTGVPRLPNTPTNNANYAMVDSATTFVPRTPRLIRSDQNYSRLGATLTAEARPDEYTHIVVDALYSRYIVLRDDSSLSALSFSRAASAQGSPEMSVVDAVRADDGTLVYGLFNGVDLTADLTRTRYTTSYKQINASVSREFGRLTVDAYIGTSTTTLDKPERTQLSLYADNVNGFSFDFRNNRRDPTLVWGPNVNDPNIFSFAPTLADGEVKGVLALQTGRDVTNNQTNELNAKYRLTDAIDLRAGIQYRISSYSTTNIARVTQNAVPAMPAGVTMAQLTSPLTGFGSQLPGNNVTGWLEPDYNKINAVYHFTDQTGDFAMAAPTVGTLVEKVSSAYAMAEFDTDILPVRLRGNVGFRFVRTLQSGVGSISGTPLNLSRHYDDFLPSATVAADLTDGLILRVSGAKVMSRPELSDLVPGTVSIALNTRTVSSGNFVLDPIRANTADASLEYYYGKSGLISVSYFYKDIGTFIQTLQRNIPYSETGLPLSLLTGSNNDGTTIFTVSNKTNTPGGPLHGVEVNVQQSLDFLPGFWQNFGVQANYTHVESSIVYCTNSTCSTTMTAALVNLSPNTFNATVYYEDDKLSVRMSGSYRDAYLLRVPSGRAGSDVQGNISTFFLDATASYQVTPELQVRLEGQNLLNTEQGFYMDTTRRNSLYSAFTGRKFSIGVAYKL